MLASFARHRAAQAGTALVVLGALGFGFMSFLRIAFQVQLAIDDPGFWWANAFIFAAGLSYLVLFQQISIAQLTFESDNRSTRIRMTCAAQFWLLWLLFMGYHLYQKTPWRASSIEIVTNLSIVHWAAVGLFASTEPDHLSRRVRRQLPKSRIARMLVAPLMPGGSRGYLFFVLHVAALWVLSVALTFDADRALAAAMPTVPGPGQARLRPDGSAAGHSIVDLFVGLSVLSFGVSWHPVVRTTSVLCCYALIYIGIGAMLSRWLRSVVVDARSSHLRVLTFFVFGAGLIAPLIPKMINPRAWRGYSVIEVPNPFVTYDAILRDQTLRDFQRAMPILLIVTVMVLLLNARAMVRGVKEIVGDTIAQVPPTLETPFAPAANPREPVA
jgi:hypothetical protein